VFKLFSSNHAIVGSTLCLTGQTSTYSRQRWVSTDQTTGISRALLHISCHSCYSCTTVSNEWLKIRSKRNILVYEQDRQAPATQLDQILEILQR